MRKLFATVLMLTCAGFALAQDKAPVTFNFDSDKEGGAPAGFQFGRTGGGREGKWVVFDEEISVRSVAAEGSRFREFVEA